MADWLDTIADYTQTYKAYEGKVNSVLPEGMTVNSIFKNMISGAKDRFVATTGQALANDPRVKAAVKEGTGNRLGNWMLDNWYIPAGVIAATVLFVILWRGRR